MSMAELRIEKTDKTPRVLFNPENAILELEGNSRPENVRDFYYPVIHQIQEYFNSLNEKEVKDKSFRISFKMGYFNSSSAKFIADILFTISEYSTKGFMFKVDWFYEDGDDDMRGAGEDFAEMTGLNFQYVMIKRNEN
jgi:hypothetical protein